jgi:hypothetical protein
VTMLDPQQIETKKARIAAGFESEIEAAGRH